VFGSNAAAEGGWESVPTRIPRPKGAKVNSQGWSPKGETPGYFVTPAPRTDRGIGNLLCDLGPSQKCNKESSRL
jgi:hypothetical protein